LEEAEGDARMKWRKKEEQLMGLKRYGKCACVSGRGGI
jgi:hypothetical protein